MSTHSLHKQDYPDFVASNRQREVWDCLALVTDPELDESVTELRFVTSVDVVDTEVSIGFHLPTYWCAANFAYMMASDMRLAIQALPWVESVCVQLHEHMYSETINRGIAASDSFQDTFGDEANDDIDVVREKFRLKAFQQRQELLIRYLLANGHTPASIATISMQDLESVQIVEQEGQHLLQRYLQIRKEWSVARHLESNAFVTGSGQLLNVESFDSYLSELRSIRINTQFNGEICRGLLAARYGQPAVSPSEVRIQFPAFENKQSRTTHEVNQG